MGEKIMKVRLKQIPPLWYALSAPLLLFPLMINVRVFPFVSPNEEPKWAILVLCGIWMAIATAWIGWRRSEPLPLRFSIAGSLLLLFFLILGVGIFVGVNPVEGAIRFAFWVAAGAVWLMAAWAARHEERWLEMLGWSISIGSFLFSLRYWWSYALDYGKPGYNVGVLFSPIGHVNFTGDVLIVLLPALVWLLAVRSDPVLKVMNWFSVATAATVLLVASSRGARGGLAAGLLVVAPFVLKHGKVWLQTSRRKELGYRPLIWVGTALLAAIVVYQSLPYHYRELARVSGTLQTNFESRTLTAGVEQPPLAGFWLALSPWLGDRTPIFASTTAMAVDAPLLGYGTGNFAWIYPSYSNRYPDFRDGLSSERTFTTNPHNAVLQIASQNGIPAALIFLGLLGLFCYRLIRALWKEWNGWLAAGLLAITAAIFDAMFNHVFFNPASLFVFALLGGTWWGSLSGRETLAVTKTVPAGLGRGVAVALLLATIGLSVWSARWLVSEWNVGRAMSYMKYPAKASEYYDYAYVWDAYNFRALFGRAQVAYRQKRYGDAVRILNEFEKIYPYNPPALNMLGAACLMSGRYQEAEAALQRALRVLPSFQMARQNLAMVQSILHSRSRQPGIKPPIQP